MCIVPFKP